MKNQGSIELDEAVEDIAALLDHEVQRQVSLLGALRDMVLEAYEADEPVPIYDLSGMLLSQHYHQDLVDTFVFALEASAAPELTITAEALDALRVSLIVEGLIPVQE